MTAILGISALYHDSAAALVVDGKIVAAAQEERFTRIKHDPSLPHHAIDYCLEEAGLSTRDLDYVGFYDKPLLKFDRLLETYLAYAPAGLGSFFKAMPQWLKLKLHVPREIRKALKRGYQKRIVFCEHHESHAASAFFPSPFEEAAILTVDGVGEWATASIGAGRGNTIELSHELHFPHSLGMLYSAFTSFCGFKVNSGEYKLMGLAPYGEPTFADTIREHLIDLRDDGSFRLDMSYFNYAQGLTMTSRRFDRLFGGPPRRAESALSQREMDLAASVQVVTEEIVLRMAHHVHAETKQPNLCLAGGVALNCVANGRLVREGPFQRIWIQPAAGDAGGALGVALLTWHQLLGNERTPCEPDGMQGAYLGPRFDEQAIRDFLDETGARYELIEDRDELCRRTAALIDEGNVVGWMQDRMEFGPRALGARSILGDARSERMQSIMNRKIKFRESFRPFAPSALRERASEYFDLPDAVDSPYMLLVADVHDSRLEELDDDAAQLAGLDKLKAKRSCVPAITHVNNSARLQTVDPVRHPRYHKLLSAFDDLTGTPVIINTSFNVRGEPIVCAPEHAYRCFMATNMDVLVMERFLLHKRDQPDAKEHEVDDYLAQFQLD